MKSLSLWLCAIVVSLPLSAVAVGQDNRGGTLLHRQPTSLVNQTAVASAVPTSTVAPSQAPAFPSLLPSDSSSQAATQRGSSSSDKLVGPAVTVTSSLAVVLGLFAGLVWVSRKVGGRSLGPGTIPNEVFQSLGSAPIDSRTRIVMFRCGNRVLVTAQTASGMQSLAEITDPDEVRRLTATCLGDSKNNFATTMKTIEKEKPGKGFLGGEVDQPAPRPRGRLFTTA